MNEQLPDPSLAAERTQLAWQRTAFSLAVIAVLALRAGIRGQHDVAAFAIAAVIGAVSTWLQIFGPRLEPRTAIRVVLASSLGSAAASLVLVLL